MIILESRGWSDYELVDSGDGRKLERYGKFLLDRPDPQVLWRKRSPSAWNKSDAFFEKETSEVGHWVKKDNLPDLWLMTSGNISFYAGLTPFKHTGVFPEQESHWHWLKNKISSATRPTRVLNLFAYTGIATLFAASAGAEVVHVDSSRKSLSWARENQLASGLDKKKIRWILDDATSFVKRESRRGNLYEAIIMDPPVYGHGPSGQKWDFDHDFSALISLCRSVLAPNPLFVLVSAYATTNSAITLGNVLVDVFKFPKDEVVIGELAIEEKASGRLLPAGIFTRWENSPRTD